MIQNTYTSIPNTTLNALKQMLFTQEGRTDLSNIIADLGGDDLTAINVALVHKGIVPEIDQQSRYEKHYGNKFFRYDFIRYSLIRDKVEVQRTLLTLQENNDACVKEISNTIIDLNHWLNMTTNAQEVITQIK